jgi:hypothetical protein
MKMNRRSSLIEGAAFTACAALGHAVPAAARARALVFGLRRQSAGSAPAPHASRHR